MKDLIIVILKLVLGAIIFLLPLLVFAVVVGLIHIEFSFSQSIQWVMSANNPLSFLFAIFYFFYAVWSICFTLDKIYSNGYDKITVPQIQKLIEEIQPQKLTEIFSQTIGKTKLVLWAGGQYPKVYYADWQDTQRFFYDESDLTRIVEKYNQWVDMAVEEKEKLSGSCNDTQPRSNFLVWLLTQ